jgi:hypothetical protein
VYIGYYDDQDMHSKAKIRLVDLMAIHEFGSPENGIIPRPVLQNTQSYGMFTPEDKLAIKRAFTGYFVKKIQMQTPLNKIGQYYEDKGKNIFGNLTYLAATQNGNDPLIQTSELKDNFLYRTSITYTTQG